MLFALRGFAMESIQADSLTVSEAQVSTIDVEANTTKTPKIKKPFVPNSTVALLWSIIPGGGQLYNRQYWKLPIIATAYTACYYAISWNHANLIDYATAYSEFKSEDPMEHSTWKDFVPFGQDPQSYLTNASLKTSLERNLKRGRDFFRRNRDLSIIVAVAVYALVMVDAYVDAELFTFDISPDISMSIQPTVQKHAFLPQQSLGVGLAFSF
ncbi:MAG: DUF5683 domain-containing protein [Porphyromonas sp.]|nr:DUF5683 domain-containing protein [Porphyromonas sp.]